MIGHDINRKLEFFFKNKTKLHIACSGRLFYNGYIFDLTSEKDLFILTDDVLGEVPILFEEVERIEPFKERRGG